MPDVSRLFWLLITSDSLVGATESTTLTIEASLIRCTAAEADELFASHDLLTIHRSPSQCPGVLITGIDGSC
jgi:hypothetical protein